jgi:hypothetical protein
VKERERVALLLSIFIPCIGLLQFDQQRLPQMLLVMRSMRFALLLVVAIAHHTTQAKRVSPVQESIQQVDGFVLRQALEGDGFHRTLVFNATFQGSEMPPGCALHAVSVLPRSVYIDVDELAGLDEEIRTRLVVDASLPAYLDIEKPAEASRPFMATTPLAKEKVCVYVCVVAVASDS